MKTHHKILAGILAIVLCLTVGSGLFGNRNTALAYDEKNAVIKVNSSVNVRTGAGTNYDIVTTSSGTSVKLTNGTEITIIGEDTASDGSLWYQIQFRFTDGKDYTGYIHSDYAMITEIDDDFEAYLDSQGFPESYRPALRTLHATYPNWVFRAYQTNLDWNEVIENESVLGRNLVNNSTSPSSWKSIQSGAYDWENSSWVTFDSGGWVMASSEIIQYYMDPRNFLTDTAIFEFLYQSYDSSSQNKEGLSYIVSGTFLDGSITDTDGSKYSYSDLLMEAAEESGVSPYVLAASIIQEIGTTASSSISGTVSGYTGLFNYYNIGAYRTSTLSAVQRGLWYAGGSGSGATSYMRPWNTHRKAIVGGAIWYGEQYVNVGQDTIYLKKFNVQGSNMYSHQYMTNVGAAYDEAVRLAKAYSNESRQASLEFSIPVYNNMPSSACVQPTGTGSPNYLLSDLTVKGYDLTPAFNRYTTEYSVIVEEDVDSVTISAEAYDSTASISGTGSIALDVGMNTVAVTVKAQNGTTITYNINIAREGEDTSADTKANNGSGSKERTVVTADDLFIDDENMMISGIQPSSSAEDLIKQIDVQGSVEVRNSDGSVNSGTVGTGNLLVICDDSGTETARYKLLIYGDVNGDGKVSSVDLLRVQKHILQIEEMDDVYLTASDANHDGKVSSTDLLTIQKYILQLDDLEQH